MAGNIMAAIPTTQRTSKSPTAEGETVETNAATPIMPPEAIVISGIA